MARKSLKSRIEKYADYLDKQIADMKSVIEFESMLGSVAEEKRRDAYINARDRLYELFPEIQKNQTPCSLPYDRVRGMFEPLESRDKRLA